MQTSKDFEWVIVDDGSDDTTQQLVNEFIGEGKVIIRYFFQAHGGMHRAMNRCVKEAKGEWLFKIDSDDYIIPTAISWLESKIKLLAGNDSIAVISGCRCNTKGVSWVRGFHEYSITTSVTDLVFHKKIKGEFAECFRGSILRAYPWPEFEGEYYCPFSVILYRIARDGYKFKYYNEHIMVSEYLPGGLHKMGNKKYVSSPVGSCLSTCEKVHLDIPLRDKMANAKQYWFFYNFKSLEKKPWIGIKWIWLFPWGYFRYLKYIGKLKKIVNLRNRFFYLVKLFQ